MAYGNNVLEDLQAVAIAGTLANNAKADVNLSLPDYWATAGVNKAKIVNVTAVAELGDTTVEGAFDLLFWGDDQFDNAVPNTENYLGEVSFAVADGEQVAGADSYRYSRDMTMNPLLIIDKDLTSELHYQFVWRTATSLHASDTVSIRFTLEAVE